MLIKVVVKMVVAEAGDMVKRNLEVLLQDLVWWN